MVTQARDNVLMLLTKRERKNNDMRMTLAMTLLLALAACGDPMPAGPGDDLELEQVNIPLQLPHRFVDARNTGWTCRGLSKFKVVNQSLVNEVTPPTESSAPPVPLTEQDLDKLAYDFAAFRSIPIRGSDGVVRDYDCVSDPNYDLARKLKAGHVFPDAEESADGEDEGTSLDKTNCCGNDDRDVTTYDQYFPRIGYGEQGSATGFGAAHTVYDTINNVWIKVDRDGDGDDDWPKYRRETAANQTNTSEIYSCYVQTVPAAWSSATSVNYSTVQYDYLAIDFSRSGSGNCADTSPIESWFGTLTLSDSTINAATMHSVQYPAWVNLSGGSINSGLSFTYSQGTWGAVIDAVPYHQALTNWTQAYGAVLKSYLDATQGASGSPLVYLYNVDSERVVATHHGYYPTDDVNLWRRWDSTVSGFVTANSLYPDD
jgi:hypothetical protein